MSDYYKTKLIFKSSERLINIAKEILKTEEYRDNGYTGLSPEQSRICLVKDDGVYLMSGAKNSLVDVVYANGFNPKINPNCWDDARDAVGGDDFCDYIPINEKDLRLIIEKDADIEIGFSSTKLTISITY